MRRTLHIVLVLLTVPLCCATAPIAAIDLKDPDAPTTAPAPAEGGDE